jgi:hypothetical protein
MNQVTKKRKKKNLLYEYGYLWLMKCYVRMMMTLVEYGLN